MRRSACLLLAMLLVPATSAAYEPAPTHPGLTARAMLASQLHGFLRKDCGLKLGLFQPLGLAASAMSPRDFSRLGRDLRRLDPSGGYAPDEHQVLRAAGWGMAGSVLAQIPASLNRHHFYCPPLRTGLDDRAPVLGTLLGFLAMLEGGDTVREFFTGTGFDLTGIPATRWIRHQHNRWSVDAFHDALAASITAPTPALRDHHLALALVALGGVLHVLQDMASPTQVRNDFVGGRLQKLGSSTFDRGSAYERFVARRYGQFGVPRYQGAPIRSERIEGFFTNPSWNGLADIASVGHFSPGTLPAPVQILESSDPGELRQRINGRLPLTKPSLGPIDLACLRRHERCHVMGKHGPLAAYHVDKEGQLRFFLDDSCHAATARHLLPLAVGYSTGLIDHLLRARIALTEDRGGLRLTNRGVPLKAARAVVLAENGKGQRGVVAEPKLSLPAGGKGELARFSPTLPQGTRALYVLVRGTDEHDEPFVAVTRMPVGAAPGKTKK